MFIPVNLLLLVYLFPGRSQEIPWLRDPPGDDGGVEVFKLRISEGGVHQHLPRREGDPVRLSGCRQTNQISRRVGKEGRKGVTGGQEKTIPGESEKKVRVQSQSQEWEKLVIEEEI